MAVVTPENIRQTMLVSAGMGSVGVAWHRMGSVGVALHKMGSVGVARHSGCGIIQVH